MKIRILNYRVNATNPLITPLSSIGDDQSISDFDAFIFDPAALISENPTGLIFGRRQGELSELIHTKGGVILCIMQPADVMSSPNIGQYPRYGLLNTVAPKVAALLARVQRGAGSQVTVVRSSQGASAEYLRTERDNLAFSSSLSTTEDEIKQLNGKILAVNSVGNAISVEFVVGEGLICVVPREQNSDPPRIGGAIAATVLSHFGNPSALDEPEWTGQIIVPGANTNDSKIESLRADQNLIEREISTLEHQRAELLAYRGLLFGYGKAVLEFAVRSAFSLLGFKVPDPAGYKGEWDFELRDSSGSAIGEIEGSEGFVDLKKYRQLNDYIGDEELEGRDHKGILVGNGFRLTNPMERGCQFSEHALRGVKKRGFCAVPCTELFAAVCAVLEAEQDANLKSSIRASILSTAGMWKFVRKPNAESTDGTSDQ